MTQLTEDPWPKKNTQPRSGTLSVSKCKVREDWWVSESWLVNYLNCSSYGGSLWQRTAACWIGRTLAVFVSTDITSYVRDRQNYSHRQSRQNSASSRSQRRKIKPKDFAALRPCMHPDSRLPLWLLNPRVQQGRVKWPISDQYLQYQREHRHL